MSRGPTPELMGRVRGDGLPDFFRYQDDGCEVSPKCVECPLPMCRYEHASGLRGVLNMARDEEIWQMKRAGVYPPEIAKSLGVSLRTVFRALEARKAASAA